MRNDGCIIEQKKVLGGLQAESPFLNSWIATQKSQAGIAIAKELHENILNHQIECRFQRTVKAIEKNSDSFTVITEAVTQNGFLEEASLKEDLAITSKIVVIASGVYAATGNLKPTENMIFGPGKKIIETSFENKRVAILGGGDNAFENYFFIKERGAKAVHIFARSIRARKEFLERVTPNDVFFGHHSIDEDQLRVNQQSYDYIVVMYGWMPAIFFIKNLKLECDSKGFLQTDAQCQASIKNIFAIGEVTQKMYPCCVTAMAEGVTAAKAIQHELEHESTKRFIEKLQQ